MKLEDKYRGMTEEEREEERRKLEGYEEWMDRMRPRRSVPLCGYTPENDAYKA